MLLIDWGNDMLQNKIELENETGEELFTLAELVKLNPEFTVDQLRKWIETGRLEAIKHAPGGAWWTSEEALDRAKRRFKRRNPPALVAGMSEKAKAVCRLQCGYERDKEGNYYLIKREKK